MIVWGVTLKDNDFFVYCSTDSENVVVRFIGSEIHSFICGMIHCDEFEVVPSDFRINGNRIYILVDSNGYQKSPLLINSVGTYMVRGQIFVGDIVLCCLDDDGSIIGFDAAAARRLALMMMPSGVHDCEPIDYIDL